MLTLSYVLLSLHFSLLGMLSLLGIHRLSMAWRWLRLKNGRVLVVEKFTSLPTITVQVPLYNERLVAERIVHAVAQIDYPADKLQIQIVDDSNDETSELVAMTVDRYLKQGINITHIRRGSRKGYKAGALKEAMISATGEFIAIFDADFVPTPSILKDTIDHFTNKKVAVIQCRWDYLNRFDSRLTETQAMILDAHFVLEQQVRYANDLLFNFNGTAGIWRKCAIIDAGNWTADTLTEDLDLSYRAQLIGWKLIYLNDVACSGELPADMNAFKSQQHRWAKGGIQVLKKMLLTIWRSPLNVSQKIESTFHLSNNLAYFIMLTDTLFLLVPSLVVRDHYHIENLFWLDITLVLLSSGGHLVYFYCGQVALGKSRWRALKNMPYVLLLGIQLAYNNARACVEALLGLQSEFVRTPKVGEPNNRDRKSNRLHNKNCSQSNFQVSKSASLTQNRYQSASPRGGVFEAFLGMVYLLVLIWGISHALWWMLPFMLFLVIGFFSTAFNTLKNQVKSMQKKSCQ